jgi:hypothetical protein
MSEKKNSNETAKSSVKSSDYDEKKRRLLKKIAAVGVGMPVALKMMTMEAHAS